MTAVELIAFERTGSLLTEMEKCGHEQGNGEMALCADLILEDYLRAGQSEDTWPEELACHVVAKHANDPIRRLTIAAALLAAEIDRLQRLGTNRGCAGAKPTNVTVRTYSDEDCPAAK